MPQELTGYVALRKAGIPPPDEKRCIHQVMKTGERCKNWKAAESNLCGHHGRAPKIQAARLRRVGEKKALAAAEKAAAKRGPRHVKGAEDVIELLEERMGKQASMVEALDAVVEKLLELDQLRYEHRAGEQLRGEVNAWLALNQQVTKLGSDYLKIGLAEKRVAIAEAQARILLGVIQAVLGRLELTREQKKIAATVVPEELQRAAIEAEK